MKTIIQRNILQFAVGRQIFCPHCQHILDMRNAVNVEVEKGGKTALDTTICGTCYDKIQPKVAELAAASGTTVTTIDGRELWPRKRKTA